MSWVRVAATGDIGDDAIIGVQAGGREIALYRLDDGVVYATDGICTHGAALLAEGWLEDGCVECPLHAGKFDVRTGKAMCPPLEFDLATFAVREEDGDILIEIED